MMNIDDKEVKVKSLSKALRILECFTAKRPELGITQISEMLGVSKSNVHNIVSTFVANGYLEKNEITDKYHLGLKVLEFSFVVNENLGYQKVVYKILEKISNETNQVVYFAVPKGSEILYLSNTYPHSSDFDFPVRSIMGEKAPMYCTSMGKAILAFMSEEEAEKIIKEPKPRFTEKTLVTDDDLRRDLDKIRKRGYGIDDEEHEYGIKCVGVPVYNCKGQIVGGVSVSGAKVSFTDENLDKYSKILREAAYQMRERL